MKLFIAIPAMDEWEYLPQTLNALAQQKTTFPFHVYICVNQPDIWWKEENKISICENNQKLLKFLKNYKKFNITIIDKTSIGKGWENNKFGVGWARKTLFDEIMKTANEEDVLISLDADTVFNDNYLQSIGENFTNNKMEALSLPYYHKLTEDEKVNRAILRYEIYLRNYFINMHLIDSPYAFTAIGSAIAVTVKALRKIRGLTPLRSGEDFYLLQKLRKMTDISNYNSELVYPAARFSHRVPFGTGPAMLKGSNGDWASYPIYHHSLFKEIQNTYHIIPELFYNDVDTEFINFLKTQYKTNDLWSPLRKNFKTLPQFTRAFHEKADGLRILQFLKSKQEENKMSEEMVIHDNLKIFQQNIISRRLQPTDADAELSLVRDVLFEIEMGMREKNV